MNNADKPANSQYGKFDKDSAGLTKREYFAGLVMSGLMSDPVAMHNSCPAGQVAKEFVAHQAVALADALLNELEKA